MRNYFKLLKGTSSNPIVRYYEETYVDYVILLGLHKHWGMHFAYYDDSHTTLTEGILNLNRVLAEKAGIKSGMKVLDAGCGVGGSALWLVENVGASVVGITIVEQQLERANRLAKERRLENKLNFLLSDYTQTPFPNETFDVVWAIESVCYAKNKKDFLREAFRLLKPDGKIVISDGFQIKENLTLWEKVALGKFTSGWAVDQLAIAPQFTGSAKDVGFKDVQMENVNAHVWRFSRWLYRWSFAAYPIAKLLEWTGLRSKSVGVKNVVGAYWQYITLKDKLWAYMIFVAKK